MNDETFFRHDPLQGSSLMFSKARSIIIRKLKRVNPTDIGCGIDAAKIGLVVSRSIIARTRRRGCLCLVRRRAA